MGELRSFPGGKQEKDEEPEECAFCHPDYPCFKSKPKHTTLSCPRVVAFSFLPFEDSYEEWSIQAVQFRDYEFEGELDLETNEDG